MRKGVSRPLGAGTAYFSDKDYFRSLIVHSIYFTISAFHHGRGSFSRLRWTAFRRNGPTLTYGEPEYAASPALRVDPTGATPRKRHVIFLSPQAQDSIASLAA